MWSGHPSRTARGFERKTSERPLKLLHAGLRVEEHGKFHLAACDPEATYGFADKNEAHKTLRDDIVHMQALQDVLFAAKSHGVLLVLQGMDASGKDGVIKHVMSGLNPAGVNVYAFGEPSREELAHDLLWRTTRVLPERGRIVVFNRSYYEDVLVTRVHPELLRERLIDPIDADKAFWRKRFERIRAFEQYLADNLIVTVKYFLHISADEQWTRFRERFEKPNKSWKFSVNDLKQRQFFDRYARVYEDMLRHTSTSASPWYVIPANHKWYARCAVANILVTRLQALDLAYPQTNPALEKQFKKLKDPLKQEGEDLETSVGRLAKINDTEKP